MTRARKYHNGALGKGNSDAELRKQPILEPTLKFQGPCGSATILEIWRFLCGTEAWVNNESYYVHYVPFSIEGGGVGVIQLIWMWNSMWVLVLWTLFILLAWTMGQRNSTHIHYICSWFIILCLLCAFFYRRGRRWSDSAHLNVKFNVSSCTLDSIYFVGLDDGSTKFYSHSQYIHAPAGPRLNTSTRWALVNPFVTFIYSMFALRIQCGIMMPMCDILIHSYIPCIVHEWWHLPVSPVNSIYCMLWSGFLLTERSEIVIEQIYSVSVCSLVQ